jgi:hypothetical protein
MIWELTEQGGRPLRPARTDSREAAELRAIKASHPELSEAVELHLELLELQRRIQGRVPLPWLELNAEILTRHNAEGRPVLRFEDIPLDLTDLRLMVRQTADVLRRHGALEEADYQKVQTLGRDMKLLSVAGQWYRSAAENHAVAAVGVGRVNADSASTDQAVASVLALAMRPFLSRCAEVLQQRAELAWRRTRLCGDHTGRRAPSHLRPLYAAMEIRAADLSVLRKCGARADHVICDPGRPLPCLCVRRLPAVLEGV